MAKIKDGKISHSKDIDFTGDLFKRSAEKDPGYYVMFGMWKGPFASAEEARSAYSEWAFELKYS